MPERPKNVTGVEKQSRKMFTLMTYNVHSCIGMDGLLSPERVARNIARYQPDIVALQELDMGGQERGAVDQAHIIAQHLAMDFHFHSIIQVEEESYGNAILSHLPMRLIKAQTLPGLTGPTGQDEKPGYETGYGAGYGKPSNPRHNRQRHEERGALWVAVNFYGVELNIINTHLGLNRRERLQQIDCLLSDEWLAHKSCAPPVILCGDFNAPPVSRVCRRLRKRFDDVQRAAVLHRPRRTFFGRYPTSSIDHIFVSSNINVVDVEVPDSELGRIASDHLPLITELYLNSG